MAVISVTSAWAFPTITNTDTSVGVNTWTSTQNILVSDGSTARSGTQVAAVVNTKAHLILGGVIQTSVNKGTNVVVSGTPNMILGGAADLWSATLTPEILNASDFGLALAYGEATGSITKSHYILAKGFNLNIPLGATIKGIETSTVQYDEPGHYAAIDYVALRVFYEYEPTATGKGRAGGYISVEDTGHVAPQKYLRYLISTPDGTPVGEWSDVTSDFSIKREMNNALASLNVTLARNELTKISKTAPLVTEAGQTITDENGEVLIIDVAASTGLGPGTDLDLNLNIDVIAYYGEYQPLLTEDGEPILSEEDKTIVVTDENNAPDGRVLFTGYITDWEVDFGSDDSISVSCINDGNDLNHIILGREGGVSINNNTKGSSVVPTQSSGIGDIGQSFTMVGNELIGSMDLYTYGAENNKSISFEVDIYSGLLTGTPTLITTGYGSLNGSTLLTAQRVIFPEPASLTNGTVYTFVIRAPSVIVFACSTALAGGDLYLYTNAWGLYDFDLMFTLYKTFSETKIPFNSYDPSNMVKEIIDYANKQGAKIHYDNDSIEMTGTTVSYTFNLNTIKEALDKVVELCPADWYWTYDPGTNLYSLKSRPEAPTRWFTKKKDVSAGKIRKSIARIINKVFFTGGGDPALLVVENDYASQLTNRIGLAKISDQRVTLDSTARILAQSQIARLKEPEWVVNFTVNPKHYTALENISVGDLAGLSNFGYMLDALQLQIVGLTYKVDSVDVALGSLLPAFPKRIEDIKRNLDTVEQQYNPTAPS